MTTVAPSPAAPGGTSPAAQKQRGRGGSTLWRYLVIRFLLIFPTVFILVTMVFVLMRITGDPITPYSSTPGYDAARSGPAPGLRLTIPTR